MKVSYNWINRHIDLKEISPEKLGNILTDLGLEVEGMLAYSSIPGGLEGITVGEVVECEKHPDADRLKITKVDIGEAEVQQIVCGGPNVAVGQKVAVANVGTTLYSGGEEFIIKKVNIRGVESNGMICSEAELLLGDSHEGIMVLPDHYEKGKPLKDYIEVYRDFIYDIGLTPNRSDATHHRGVAKDLNAYFAIHAEDEYTLKSLDYSIQDIEKSVDISLKVSDPKDCPRYAGIIIDGIEVKDSPRWIQDLLKSLGLKPVNNVVDLTNFILHDMGQPLHAFDYDKIKGNEIRVQHLPKGSSFKTLDGKEITLSEEDLVICDGEDNAICLAGVYGGEMSGVTASTTRIFLESAHFNAETIRKTSMRHLLRTDAAKIFEKGSDPAIVLTALKRSVYMLREITGGEAISEIVEFYPQEIVPATITLRYDRVNRIIGKVIDAKVIKEILRALGMKINAESKNSLSVQVTTDKNEVLREIDVIEEILRVYGFDQIPAASNINNTTFPLSLPDTHSIRRDINKLLQGKGFLEMMNVSLTNSAYFKDEEDLIFINNTSNKNLDILRPDMVVSALETAAYNINHNQKDLAFYEWGKSYRKERDTFREEYTLALFLSGNIEEEHWNNDGEKPASFYNLKTIVELILHRLGINTYQVKEVYGAGHYAYSLKYHRGPIYLVEYGRLKSAELERFDIEQDIYVAVFHWENVEKNIPSSGVVYTPINKFPSISRDLALVVKKSVKYSEIKKIVTRQLKRNLVRMSAFDIYVNDDLFGPDRHSLAIRMELSDPHGTMNEKQIESLMKKVINQLKIKIGVELR